MKRNRFDVAPQALLLAAGVVLSIVLISIMVNQFEQARAMAAAVSDNMIGATESIKCANVMQYDGVEVTGADVRNFYKKYMQDGMPEEFLSMTVDNGISSNTGLLPGEYRSMTDSGSDGYVNPIDRYYCTIDRNANGIILNVAFTVIR